MGGKLKNFGDQLAYISDVKKCAFGALFRLRAKFSKKPRTKLGARGRPARRAGLALLFIVREGRQISFSREARRNFLEIF